MRSAGPLTARPPIRGLTATAGTRARRERLADRSHGEDRADRDVGVARREEDQVGIGDRLEDAGRRCGRVFAFEADGVDLVAVAARDEPLLERKLARRRPDPRPQPVVRRRQQMQLDSERLSESHSDARERLAGAERLGADEVEAQVEIAEPEPRLPAERAHGLEHAPRLVRAAPAAALVVETGERVEDRVEVGRDVQTEHLEVVADVADDGDVARLDDVDEALDEPRSAHPAGENGDLHPGRPSFARHTRVRGPERGASRTRSASASASSRRPGRVTETTVRPERSACSRNRAALSSP